MSRRPAPGAAGSPAVLSRRYRLAWRLQYVLLCALGPAQLSEDQDPRVRMRAERAARVKRLETGPAPG